MSTKKYTSSSRCGGDYYPPHGTVPLVQFAVLFTYTPHCFATTNNKNAGTKITVVYPNDNTIKPYRRGAGTPETGAETSVSPLGTSSCYSSPAASFAARNDQILLSPHCPPPSDHCNANFFLSQGYYYGEP